MGLRIVTIVTGLTIVCVLAVAAWLAPQKLSDYSTVPGTTKPIAPLVVFDTPITTRPWEPSGPEVGDSGILPNGSVALTVGYETTRLVAPVVSDGLIDYAGALDNAAGRGTAAGDNVAVALLQAMWPTFLSPDDQQRLVGSLGMNARPSPPFFMSLKDYAQRRGTPVLDNIKSFVAAQRPWKAAAHPIIVDWLSYNKPHIDAAAAASGRSQFYLPIMTLDGNAYASPISSLVGPPLDALVTSLIIRAMLNGGSGIFGGADQSAVACDDLKAACRLLAKSYDCPDLAIILASQRLQINADLAMAELAGTGALSEDQIRSLSAVMRALHARCAAAFIASIDTAHRYQTLCVLSRLQRENSGAIQMLLTNPQYVPAIDWLAKNNRAVVADFNVAARGVNQFYDKVNEEFRREPHNWAMAFSKLRLGASTSLGADQPALAQLGQGKFWADVDAVSRASLVRHKVTPQLTNAIILLRARQIEELVLDQLLARTWAGLTTAVMEIEAYRRKNGQYPDSPGTIVMPADVYTYTGQPLMYRREQARFVLWSVGPDGQNNDGKPESDDIVYNPKAIQPQYGDGPVP